MAGSSIPANPSSHHVHALVSKFSNADPDIRYMSLNDLHQMLMTGHQTFLHHDYNTCTLVVEAFLKLLVDQNGDVQNMAIKCLGPFVNRAPDNVTTNLIEKISCLQTENTIDNSLPALAMRTIVSALPRQSQPNQKSPRLQEAFAIVTKTVIPRLVGNNVSSRSNTSSAKGMLQKEIETGQENNAVDVVLEVAQCFGPHLHSNDVKVLQKGLTDVLENSRCSIVMKKKAVNALSVLSIYFSDVMLSSFISYTIEILHKPSLVLVQKRLYFALYQSMALLIPRKFGPYLRTLCPFVLSVVTQAELDKQDLAASSEEMSDSIRDPMIDEVREAALSALTVFINSCPNDMTPYMKDSLESALRFVKYDPNVVDEDVDMMDDENDEMESNADDDFEEETGFDDEDDVSWKVRRSAVQLLNTMVIRNRLPDDNSTIESYIPPLISRFNEREEVVRIEVLETLIGVIGNIQVDPITQSADAEPANQQLLSNRKRRRGSSSAGVLTSRLPSALTADGCASPTTPAPSSVAQQTLARLSPDIITAASKLLSSSTLQSKQLCLKLLTTIVKIQRGGLSNSLHGLMPSVLDILSSSSIGIGSAAAVNKSLCTDALLFLTAVADFHPSSVLQPYLPKIASTLTTSVQTKQGKLATVALGTVNAYVKVMTPPRSAATQAQTANLISEFFTLLVKCASSTDTETEVRQKAVEVLGFLLKRTATQSGSSLLPASDRRKGLDLILERLQNETTRLSAVHAVEVLVDTVQAKEDLPSTWIQKVSKELCANLRKSDRNIRSSSLTSLKVFASNAVSRAAYNDETIRDLVIALLPLLTESKFHMLAQTLTILNGHVTGNPKQILTPDIVTAICRIAKLDLQGSTLDALIDLVEQIGEADQGAALIPDLLCDVDKSKNIEVVGRVIGTLLVSSREKGNIGVTTDDFRKESRSTKDTSRKSLALYILGEVGLRLGYASDIMPADFLPYFDDASEMVQTAAAISYGRAGAGNVRSYLPNVLAGLQQQGNITLLLFTIKEMLQQVSAEVELLASTQDIWNKIVAAAKDLDNRALGAECIGRLAILDPTRYLPLLKSELSSPDASLRGMMAAGLRFTLSDTESSYDGYLEPIIVDCLTRMLDDDDLHNRRLGLTTFNSAAHNKPNLIVPHLPILISRTMRETLIRPELIQQVTMGPFKHKVDQGLDLRKTAYETLYALVDIALSSTISADFFERLQVGLGDEHEIKIASCLILTKLVTLAPNEISHSLDSFCAPFKTVLATKPKESAVKQELEKVQDQNKAVIKLMLLINESFPSAVQESLFWQETMEWTKKELPLLVRQMEEEAARKQL